MVQSAPRNKYLRVSDLVEWGLNAPLYQKVDSNEVPLCDLFGLLARRFGSMRLSVRGLGGSGRDKLFLMNTPLKDILDLYLDDIEKSLPVMVSQGLPLEKGLCQNIQE